MRDPDQLLKRDWEFCGPWMGEEEGHASELDPIHCQHHIEQVRRMPTLSP
jgi:hypothetical protein